MKSFIKFSNQWKYGSDVATTPSYFYIISARKFKPSSKIKIQHKELITFPMITHLHIANILNFLQEWVAQQYVYRQKFCNYNIYNLSCHFLPFQLLFFSLLFPRLIYLPLFQNCCRSLSFRKDTFMPKFIWHCYLIYN